VSRSRALVLLAALLPLGGCALGPRMHLGDVWLQAGQGLDLVGNHVKLALH
jgi:hypothetical protein